MNASSLFASPAFAVLFKLSWLLALAWAMHGLLRYRHARWRMILWRSVLCFSLALPLFQFLAVPGLKIPILFNDVSRTEFDSLPAPVATSVPAQQSLSTAKPVAKVLVRPVSGRMSPLLAANPPRHVSWQRLLLTVWVFGCACGVIRLIRLHVRLARLHSESSEPSSELQQLVAQIQSRLRIQHSVNVQISDAVTSPFVCGLLKPVIILPRQLAQQLSANEASALLSHEVAHLHQHDLFWCIAWRWMQAICWFHPLVWHIPAAHNLACEQEADRVASGQLADQASYSQMLARLALRVLALPVIETKLTLNGGSEIARRLNYLSQTGMRRWNTWHSLAALGLGAFLFTIIAGCRLTQSGPPSANISAGIAFKQVLVVIQAQDGHPIAGATVLPNGFRVKGLHGADAYSWNKKLFGPPQAAITDRDGKAHVRYPVEGIPSEKEYTGQLILRVTHPEYAPVFIQSYAVDSPEAPIQLARGIHLQVSGYFGPDHQPVTELVPNLNEELLAPEDWTTNASGAYEIHKLSPGGHLVQLMGRLPSGDIVYSDTTAFTAEIGKDYNFALEMNPGIRLEGRLDDRVPRPIANGQVLISVRPSQFPAWHSYTEVDDLLKKYPVFHPWESYRPIAADGTFVFESVPPGGLDIIVQGDGFVSQSGGDFQERNNGKLTKIPGFGLPQAFPLVAPMTTITVVTEPSAILELTAKTKTGKPVVGATVYVNPNVVRMGGIFGEMAKSSEAPFRTLAPLADVPYHATTDANGVAVIRNLPAFDRGIEVEDSDYQVPLQDLKGWRDRHIRTQYSPGQTNHFVLIMERKGKDYIGRN